MTAFAFANAAYGRASLDSHNNSEYLLPVRWLYEYPIYRVKSDSIPKTKSIPIMRASLHVLHVDLGYS